MRRLLSLAALFLSVLAAPSIDSTLAEWNEYKAAYDKFYETPEEDARRLETYLENKRMVEEHNSKYQRGETTFTMAINKFSDWFPEELDRLNGLKIDRSMRRRGRMYERQPDAVVPDSINWVEKGAVTSVKDQGKCGSGYAFSAAGAFEGLMFRNYKNITDLSAQEFIDCGFNLGCVYGEPMFCYFAVIYYGGQPAKSYPYEAKRKFCRADPDEAVVYCTWFVILKEDEETLKEAVALVGPISIGMAVRVEFIHYKSGVYDGTCFTELNHALLAVGYGKDNETGKDYWLVKNSWGTNWGENGYVRVIRGENKCLIANYSTYPVDREV